MLVFLILFWFFRPFCKSFSKAVRCLFKRFNIHAYSNLIFKFGYSFTAFSNDFRNVLFSDVNVNSSVIFHAHFNGCLWSYSFHGFKDFPFSNQLDRSLVLFICLFGLFNHANIHYNGLFTVSVDFINQGSAFKVPHFNHWSCKVSFFHSTWNLYCKLVFINGGYFTIFNINSSVYDWWDGT